MSNRENRGINAMIAVAICGVIGIVAYDFISKAHPDFGAVEQLWRAVEGPAARPEATVPPSNEADNGAEARAELTASAAAERSGDPERVAAIDHPRDEELAPAPEVTPTTAAPKVTPPAQAISAGRSAPAVQPGDPSFKIVTKGGSLDADIISRIVRAHRAEIRHCYGKGLERDPALRGSLAITWTITQSGSATFAAVAGPGFDTGVDACTVASVGRWRFPKPSAPVEVVGTFKFSPAK